jgi:hypothetical protein
VQPQARSNVLDHTARFDDNSTQSGMGNIDVFNDICLLTANSLPTHCLLTAYSVPTHCLLTAMKAR